MIKLKDLILEIEDEVQRHLDRLRKDVKDYNDMADRQYNKVYDHYVGMWTDQGRSDARQNTMFGQPSNEAHRVALQDPGYRLLKTMAQQFDNLKATFVN